ncbi:MAG TPA: hypothetical protein VNG33_03000 [Polyangiaceae bacterium]|nr:hypothetical protein [Polyangiaceae bacterium]
MIAQKLRCVGLSLLATVLLGGCASDKDSSKSSAGGSSNLAGSGNSAGSNPAGGGKSSGGTTPIGGGKSTAAEIARKLGREPNFLIGMGNDLPKDYMWDHSGIYTLGSPLDLHYIYLVNGWQDWNPGGYFAQIIAKVDVSKNTTPMSTLYTITGNGENNFATLVDDKYMSAYWTAAKLLMQRYAELDTPALVHVEPDFWAYAQQKSGGDPSTVPAHLSPDCADLPADVSGMARCWIKLARDNAPKVVVALHASEWGGGSGNDVGEFLNKLGVAEADLVVIDILDRDAGCFEDGKLAQCMRSGKFYLDETNKTSPNYSERLDFAKQVSTTTGKPILWWQLPFGVPSDTPGGTPGHFRDNKVHYLFSHVQEFVDAGGVGATFGGGAGDQTFVDTDGGQFKDAVKAYDAAPVPLP